MSICLNPECNKPNLSKDRFCQKCGKSLLLSDRYRAVEFLGAGGFGRTFKAIDEQRLDTFCVIKQFLPQFEGSGALERATKLFKEEAIRLRDLGNHPQIPNLLAFSEKELYLVQDFIEGKNLLEEFRQNGKFNEEKAKDLLNQLLPVLDFIHRNNVIHRDIKPENIIRSNNNLLMLIDFGISKQISGNIPTQVGTSIGTPGYAAPEQMKGNKVFPSTDLYCLGVTCIRLLTGCLLEENNDNLFDSYNNEWVWRHYTDVSHELGSILDKILLERAKDRYQSATEILQALNVISTPTQHQIILSSQIEIDYSPLCDLLATGKWKDADYETYRLVLKIANREKEKHLTSDDWLKFPCTEFLAIDQLWVKFSDGHFGWSVQKSIWESVGGNAQANEEEYKRFGEQIGWIKGGKWLNYSDLTFDPKKAVIGHLPRVDWGSPSGVSNGFWGLVKYLFAAFIKVMVVFGYIFWVLIGSIFALCIFLSWGLVSHDLWSAFILVLVCFLWWYIPFRVANKFSSFKLRWSSRSMSPLVSLFSRKDL